MIEIDVEPRSPEWFALRKGIPTASEFYKIITPRTGQLSAQADLYIGELIAEMVIEPDDVDSHWMARGRELEQEAINWYAFYTGYDIAPGGIIFLDDRSAAVSPDAKINQWHVGGLLEVKCLKPSHHVTYLLENRLPDEFRPQVHGALWISQCQWLDFLLYCPGFRQWRLRVVRNDYTTKVGYALGQFTKKLDAAKGVIFERRDPA